MPPLKLESSLQYIKGVGPKKAAVLAQHGMTTVHDLLMYFPRLYLDRTSITPIAKLQTGQIATIVGRVRAHGLLYGRRRRYEAIIEDESAAITITFFQGIQYWQRLFKKDQVFAVTGRVTFFDGLQMVHPELERLDDESDTMVHAGRIIPVYPQTSELNKVGLTSRGLRRLTSTVFDQLDQKIQDPLPVAFARSLGLQHVHDAVVSIHYPKDRPAVELARRRLAFDELLLLQFLVNRNRLYREEAVKPHRYKPPGKSLEKFQQNLPFSLTSGQERAIAEIMDDLAGKQPMSRLLQGDVGCGKTVVALAAAVYAAENDLQTAFMAPTEILAEQHYRTWREALKQLGLTCGLLTSNLSAAEKELTAQAAVKGEINILFGTHALIYDYVQFQRLGLVIIDEQHRFGVRQRAQLHAKGTDPDLLVMTATPIPRTLALTLYGDLEISTVDTMPPNRQPIRTVWRDYDVRDRVMEWVADEVNNGGRAYLVYPAIEPSEALQLKSVEEAHKELKDNVFKGITVGLVHGRVKAAERNKTLARFRDGEIGILMATTVIEVGLDNPDATILVIEHAERFGLAQLHQLRGRVGRGQERATVVALAGEQPSETARKRLEYFAAHRDGFKIAEADFELRGPGEVFGVRQSGLPELRIADLGTDRDLLQQARDVILDLSAKRNDLDSAERSLYSFLHTAAESREQNLSGG